MYTAQILVSQVHVRNLSASLQARSWRCHTCLAEAVALALKRVSSLIVGISESGKGLQSGQLADLDQLVAAMRRCADNRLATMLNKYV